MSEFTLLTVQNPAPRALSNVQITSTFETLFLRYATPVDADWAGILVWMSKSPGFATDETTLVYRGNAKPAIIDVEPGTTYYLKVAAYDDFTENPALLNVSSELSHTTASLVDQDIADLSVTLEQLGIARLDNLVADPSFEGTNLSDQWATTSGGGTWDVVATEGASTPFHGLQMGRFQSSGQTSTARAEANAPGGSKGAFVSGKFIEAAEGEGFAVQGRVRLVADSNGSYARASIIFYDKDGASLGETTGGAIEPPVGSWGTVSVRATAPSGSAYATFGPRLNTPAPAESMVYLWDSFDARALAVSEFVGLDEILGVHIGPNEITAAHVLANTLTAAEILAATITTNEIAANTILAGNIAANTITAAEILALTITAGEIAANTITAAKIAANTITATEIAAATITTTQIAANTIQAANIASATITGGKLVAGTITTTQIAAATIVAGDIATRTITASRITLGTLSLDEMIKMTQGEQLVNTALSSTATADFDIDQGYGAYEVFIEDLVPATDDTFVWVRVSTDGGSNFLTTTTYSWRCLNHNEFGLGTRQLNSATAIALNGSTVNEGVGTATGEGWNCKFQIYGMASGGPCFGIIGTGVQDAAGNTSQTSLFGGNQSSGSQITDIRILMSSGNMSSGRIRLFGIGGP